MILRRLTFVLRPARAVALALSCGLVFAPLALAQQSEKDLPPLDDTGRAGYREFLDGDIHRAFALAPGGAWAWVSGMPDPEVAESEAIRGCAGYTEQRCLIYAVDEQVVFDRTAWAGSWGPYAGIADAAARPVGTARGKRFPDLAVTDPQGRTLTVGDLRGRIVLLHFWGSWCAPCQVEFPELQGLYNSLRDEPAIAFVLVQAREPKSRSERWAGRHGFAMPFHDSGARGPADTSFALSDGGRIEDRLLAPLFPATYVLDSQGLVLFYSLGPLSGWQAYEPLLRHAAKHRP